MGQFEPGGALKGTTEINVLKCLCAHLETLLLFGTAGGLACSPKSHSSVELETLKKKKMPVTRIEKATFETGETFNYHIKAKECLAPN